MTHRVTSSGIACLDAHLDSRIRVGSRRRLPRRGKRCRERLWKRWPRIQRGSCATRRHMQWRRRGGGSGLHHLNAHALLWVRSVDVILLLTPEVDIELLRGSAPPRMKPCENEACETVQSEREHSKKVQLDGVRSSDVIGWVRCHGRGTAWG